MAEKNSEKFSWKLLEEALLRQTHSAVTTLAKKNPGQTFYSVVFHSCYRELDGPLDLPMLAANSLETLESDEGEDSPTLQWNPEDWRWDDISFSNKEVKHRQKKMQQEAEKGTQAQWVYTEKRFITTITKVAKRLYSLLKKQPWVTKDFIVFFDDADGGAELARKSMPTKLFLKHFPEQDETEMERRRVAAMPVARQADYLIGRLDANDGISWSEAEQRLVAIGKPSLPALTKELAKAEECWTAAQLLARISIPDEKVITALRKCTKMSREPAWRWSATALGLLGDVDYLLKLANSKKTKRIAVAGICAPYSCWANDCVKPITLNYSPLERLLEKHCPECSHLAKEILAPGRGYSGICVDDIDEALRGLKSPHLVIRKHAVCILWDRSLGKVAGKRVLPALVEKLRDRSSEVRRLAILSFSYWKRTAKPYLSHVEPLLEDQSPAVRETAEYVLEGQ